VIEPEYEIKPFDEMTSDERRRAISLTDAQARELEPRNRAERRAWAKNHARKAAAKAGT
jgi:hypothetical protein